jgi:hypothetical protein
MTISSLRQQPRILVCIVATLVAPTPSVAFDTKWHADATRHALEKHGFSADARLMCQFANYLTDYFAGPGDYIEKLNAHVPAGIPKSGGLGGVDPADVSRLHFDALIMHSEVEHNWKTLEENTRLALDRFAVDPKVQPGFRPVVLMTILCASLHAVQDFYSHSNWLKKVAATNGATPIWFEVPEADRAQANIKTGWYPDGNRPGYLYHREENKDSSSRPLNAPAYDAATRASIDWVGRLIAQTPGVPWATVKAWTAQPANLNGMWLKKPDASFITTTSTLADHWDGDAPVKNVFAPEASRNKKMAGEALQLTLGVYFKNISQSSPATPTPHWVGFTIYHVERALASQLYLQNQKR